MNVAGVAVDEGQGVMLFIAAIIVMLFIGCFLQCEVPVLANARLRACLLACAVQTAPSSTR